ncbi:MAG: proline--tRNA ligase [bacterium]|nr:proline--tRNA ligase [bacterium]
MSQIFEKKGITKKSDNISDWYIDVITKSEMADYSPVRGCIVYRPLSYAVWENIQKFLDPLLKEQGVENSYFPLFIPESFLKKEASHIEGFSPELAIVTIGGGEVLEEKLAIRPTSETIMYAMYSKWIQSHRDLPLKLNQWNNVVRWEKRTYFFLRGAEFLWQEAHTAHSTHSECWTQVIDALDSYAKTYEELLAIPVVKGLKSQSEKFAGADNTTTTEIMMPDGKALQGATSHDLGQNFSKAFEISFQNEKGENEFVYQTSFGYSTRALGALVMIHADDQGIVLPPKVAPIQVVIIPIKESSIVAHTAVNTKLSLEDKGVRVKLDVKPENTLGYKRNYYELKGIPIRLEIGEKELEKGVISISIRHNNQKQEIPIDQIAIEIPAILETIQSEMFEKALQMQKDLTSNANTFDEFKQIMTTRRGFIKALWCEDSKCEEEIKEKTKATTRCLPIESPQENGSCFHCNKNAKYRWIFAQAY